MASLPEKSIDNQELVSSVLTGTVIGRSLQEALQSLEEEDKYDDNAGLSKNDGKRLVKMNTATVDQIIKSFGEAVAESKIGPSESVNNNALAPRVLLKGRCDSYNKYGRNWMVSMDKVRIKARPIKFTKRRRGDRPSLWDRDDDGNTSMTKEITVKEKMQLLAYGDIP